MNLLSNNNAERSSHGHEVHGRQLTPEGLEAIRVRHDIRQAAYGNMYKSVALKYPELVQPQQPNYAAVTQHLVANSKIVEDKFAAQPAATTQSEVLDPITQAQQAVDAEYRRAVAERQELHNA